MRELRGWGAERDGGKKKGKTEIRRCVFERVTHVDDKVEIRTVDRKRRCLLGFRLARRETPAQKA